MSTHRGRSTGRLRIRFGAAVSLSLVLTVASSAHGQMVPAPPGSTIQGRPDLIGQIGIDQKLGDTLALDLEFTNQDGTTVRVGDYFKEKPVVLAFVYYECPMLCNLILNGVLKAINVISLDVGNDYDIVTVSMDHRETPTNAQKKRNLYLKKYGRASAEQGWHFLTGTAENIKALADSAGYRFAYDAERDEFAHASGIMVLTPDGTLSKYFYGVEYSARDLRLGLVEASAGKIGTAVDKMLLFCYRYDPSSGKYGVVIMNVLRLSSGLLLLALVAFMTSSFLRDRRKSKKGVGASAPSSNMA